MALEPVDVLDAGLDLVGAREVEHLVGHVEPVGSAGRGDAAGGEQDVDTAAGAEIEDGLPSCRSAIAVGLPQPSEASTAVSGSSSRSPSAYSPAPNSAACSSVIAAGLSQQAAAPRHRGDGSGRVALAHHLAKRLRVLARGAAAHPPAAALSQHAAFSEGSQHVSCAAAEQQLGLYNQLSHAVSSSRASGFT